jgi:hypothetical protein
MTFTRCSTGGLGALGSGGIYLLRLVPSLKQCREQRCYYRVAPEPVKQDLIDNDILESVPKTMKAKVQLLFYIHNIYIFLTHLPPLW